MPQLDVQKVHETNDRTLPIFAEFDQVADRIRVEAHKLFARRGTGDGHALDDWLAAEHQVCWPSAELTEKNGTYALKVALAGFEPGEISVTATPREIIVKAAHKREEKSSEEGETKLRWSEFRSNEVFRRVELPAAVDVEKISANLENGLLEVVAPQAQPAPDSAAQIEISTDS
jgi:HSP20 family protein